MLISNIPANLYPKNYQIRQINHETWNYNTNPLACDTFTPSVSFKSAAILRHAKYGDLEEIKKELNNGADINSTTRANETALHLAAIYNRNNVIKFLLEQDGINVNLQSSESKSTPLHYAFLDKVDDETIALLLESEDIDLTLRNRYGYTALQVAQGLGYSKRPWFTLLKEKTEYQLEYPASVGAGGKKISIKKTPVDITKLSPEENIWTKEEISKEFLNLVKAGKYDDAASMLEITPLINLEGNDNNIITEVCNSRQPKFIEKVFEYKFLKQKQIEEEYEAKRKIFFETKLNTLSYEELLKNNIAVNTIDGYKYILTRPEYNPNDAVYTSYIEFSLFDKACQIDPDGEIVKQILSKYADVDTKNPLNKKNPILKELIEDYENVGKYKIALNKIEDNAFYADERRGIAANQLKELLESPEFTPEIVDEVGNSVLHIAAALPDDMGRTLIQIALDKGVDINTGNCTGQRPLMSAIKKLVTTEDNAGKMNLMSNIKFLLDKGANINAQDNNGQTAFHFACIGTVAALLTLLLNHKPNVFLEDKAGKRACVYLKTPEMKEIYNEYINRGNNIIK